MAAPVANQWLAALQAALSRGLARVEPGFIRRDELRKHLGCKQSTLTRKIRLLKDAGLIEIRNFRIMTGMGIKAVAHYRLRKD